MSRAFFDGLARRGEHLSRPFALGLFAAGRATDCFIEFSDEFIELFAAFGADILQYRHTFSRA